MFYLSKPQLRALFQAAYDRNRSHHLALLTAFVHGMRVSELNNLRGTDITPNGEIIVRRLKGSRTTIQLIRVDNDVLFDERPLIALAQEKKTLRLFEISRQHFDRLIKKYGALAGIHPDRCHMHAMKHSCAMTVWDATGSLGQLQSYLGHVSASSSLVYLAEADSRKAQAALQAVRF
jgi:integrase